MSSSPSAADRPKGSTAGTLVPTGLPKTINAVLLTIILALALLGAEITQRINDTEARSRMDEVATRVARRIAERINLYQYGLRGLSASIQAVGIERFSREHFGRYSRSRDIESEFPGARGFGVIRRVSAGDTESFITAARRDGRPDFTLREIEHNPTERWVIQYIDPEPNNPGAEGLDIASEPNRREAAEKAVETGEPTLTQPITLVQASGRKESAFLLLRPNFRPDRVLDSPQARRTAAFGLSFSPLVIDEVLSKVDLYTQEISFSLDSLNKDGAAKRFYQTSLLAPSSSNLSTTRPIKLFGVEWVLTVHSTPAFFDRLNHVAPNMVGLLIALALAGALLLTNLFLLARKRRTQLLGSQIKLAAIVESSNDAIIGKSIDGIVTSWNRAAEEMFGYTATEAIGHSIANLIVPSDLQDEERNLLAKLQRGEKIANFITRRKRKDGSNLEVSVSISPIFDVNGQIIGAAKTVHDVTEQQLAARHINDLNTTLEQRVTERTAQLEEARSALHTVLDAMPSMVAYWDRNCINRFANRAYLEWFGVSPHDLYGTHIRKLLGDSLYERNMPYINRALQGEAQTFERDIPRPDGKGIRHAIAHYLPNLVEHSVEGFYVIVHDVTELIDSRNQLQEAREQQLRMDRLASLGLMVAGVAHELNTPLGAAMLTLDRLSEALAQFKAAVEAGLRKSDVQQLSTTFDDGLAMTSRYLARGAEIIRQFKQVASDRAGAERRVFVANEVIRDVIHLMDSQIRNGAVKVALDLQADIALDSYPGVVGQVLQNLVHNALVHAFDANASGVITISMHADPAGDAVVLTVADDGKGIPEPLRERIWDPFFTTRRGEGGTGLGLHIVQRMVTELLGGAIVQGRPQQGHGCEFVVTIPKHAPLASEEAASPTTANHT